ncbi:TPA: ABC transporter ATP-binding protein [Pseudomonas putida]|nr:ABC transporter ATP-binding protein [Pseudomonas putida]
MSVLKIENLTFAYPDKPLMENINLSLTSGECLGLLGCNGAGKTTLFDLICKLRAPVQGRIINSAKRQAYLSQTLTPPPTLRMHEVSRLITHLNAHTPPCQSNLEARLAKWSTSLSKRYHDISKKKASTCSYGEIRSFFTLTLLLMDNDLIILDEPTAGVDPEFRYFIWLGISRACADGASVLVSSHYPEEVAAHCRRFYMLTQRRLEAFDSAEQFLTRHHATTFDEAFINANN